MSKGRHRPKRSGRGVKTKGQITRHSVFAAHRRRQQPARRPAPPCLAWAPRGDIRFVLMNIDRKQFLLMAAGLSQSLSCVVVPAQPAPNAATGQPNNAQPNNAQPAAPNQNTTNPIAAPADECTSWDPSGECVGWNNAPVASPVEECSQWNPQGECIAWGDPLPADECTNWDPSGECTGWAQTQVIQPVDECSGWAPSGECSQWLTQSPADECVEWGNSSECVLWVRFRR